MARAGGRIKPRFLLFDGEDACWDSGGGGRSWRSDAPGNPAAGAPPWGDCVLRPEELLVTRQHEIRVVLPATLLWWHTQARRRGAMGCQEGAGQPLGWEDRHPEGPEGLSEPARCAGAVSPRSPTFPGRLSPPLVPPAPSCSLCLFPTRFSRGTAPPPRSPVSISPLLASTLTPSCPDTLSPCPLYAASASALPARLSLLAGFLAGLRSPFRASRFEPSCPLAGAAALPPDGARRAAAPRRGSGSTALCAVIDRDSVCRCRPMMERGGSGGPAPFGAGMRRRRAQREPESESRRSPHSNARLPRRPPVPGALWAAA